MALDIPSLQVGHGQVVSIGLKSVAYFPSSRMKVSGEPFTLPNDWQLTQIKRPLESKRYPKPSCSRRENTVCLKGCFKLPQNSNVCGDLPCQHLMRHIRVDLNDNENRLIYPSSETTFCEPYAH